MLAEKSLDLSVGNLEKLLRRVEIKRLWKDPGDLAIDDLVKISLSFMKYSDETKDYRFLNAALKINDYLRNHSDLKIEVSTVDSKEQKSMRLLEKHLELSS